MFAKFNLRKNRIDFSPNAFTLAELLITLAVIGIVAALTIPSLIESWQKHYTVNKVRKTIAIFTQAVEMAKAQEQLNFDWTEETITPEKNLEIIDKYLKPYLKVVKSCGNDKTAGCWAEPYYYLNGEQFPPFEGEDYSYFILNDGTSVRCSLQSYDAELSAKLAVTFDINGLKGPNIIGKDIFEIKFNEKELITLKEIAATTREVLLSKRQYECNKEAPDAGYGCLGVMVKDNWKISKDYPW